MKTHHRLPVILAAVLLSGMAQSQELRPINPDTLRVIEQHLPALMPPSVLLPPSKASVHTLAVYPSSYDLRSSNRVSAVKNQLTVNGCWAFSAIAGVESSLMPAETSDFSEMNMINLNGYDTLPSQGGNRAMATAYQTRWDGPVQESDDPFDDTNTISPGTVPVSAHVQDVIWLPTRTSFTDNDAIKNCVVTYGPVAADLFWSTSTYTSATASIYNNTAQTPNHMVSIIGWNDNYSRTNFQRANGNPPADGAFLFKNSWGTGWGQSGFGWISYYDVNLSQYSSCYSQVQPTSNYQHIYSYDKLGWTNSIGYGQDSAYFGAIYTAAATEQIQAVSFYTSAVGSSYQAMIYLDPVSSPVAGTAYGTTSGTCAYPGYHTIVLSSPVSVTAGHKFSAVVKLTTPGDNYPIPFEDNIPGYTSTATASAGETFISRLGSSWQDLTTAYPNASICLRAFGKPTGTMRSISGHITLGDYTGDTRYINLQAQIKRTDTPSQTITMPLYRSITGDYRIDWVPSGTHSLRIFGGHFPAITLSGLNVTSGNLTAQNLELPNGDADGNGQVNLFDFVELDKTFGQTGLGLATDMDGSLSVNLFDYVVIDQYFGAQASPAL